MREHEHGRFEGDAELVVAAAPRPETWLEPTGWAPHLGGALRIHALDCTHPELVRPAAAERIAALVGARLSATPEPVA
jgi:enterobactin synthetase component F